MAVEQKNEDLENKLNHLANQVNDDLEEAGDPPKRRFESASEQAKQQLDAAIVRNERDQYDDESR